MTRTSRRWAAGAIVAPMAATSARVLGTVVLVSGSAEYLSERVVEQARTAIRDDDPAADVTEVDAASLDVGTFVELTSPSLFADSRGVVIRGIDALPEPMHDPLIAYAASPSDEVALVVMHPG